MQLCCSMCNVSMSLYIPLSLHPDGARGFSHLGGGKSPTDHANQRNHTGLCTAYGTNPSSRDATSTRVGSSRVLGGQLVPGACCSSMSILILIYLWKQPAPDLFPLPSDSRLVDTAVLPVILQHVLRECQNLVVRYMYRGRTWRPVLGLAAPAAPFGSFGTFGDLGSPEA